MAFTISLHFLQKIAPISLSHFLQGSASVTSVIIDILKGDDPLTKYNQLSNMYQDLTDSIESTLNYLSDTTPECPAQTGVPFSWNPMRGQDYYYSKIVDDMNLKIGLGEYSVGMYLPYEKQLAGQYRCLFIDSQKGIVRTRTERFRKNIKWERHYGYRTG